MRGRGATIPGMKSFQGKGIVITGAASGIGEALAIALAAQGARLLLADVHAERLDAVAAALRERGADCLAQACDVADEAAVQALADAAQTAWAASSTTGMPWRSAIAMMASILAARPVRCTGMIAFVRGVMARSRQTGSML